MSWIWRNRSKRYNRRTWDTGHPSMKRRVQGWIEKDRAEDERAFESDIDRLKRGVKGCSTTDCEDLLKGWGLGEFIVPKERRRR